MESQLMREESREVFAAGKAYAPTSAVSERLIKRAMRGDRDALLSLCRETARGVLRRTRVIFTNSMDAEDVAQEVLIRVCESIHKLRDPGKFGAWLNRIVLNEVKRQMNKNSKRAKVLYLDDYIEDVVEENEEFLPQEFHLRNEDSKAVKDIVDGLPDQQRKAIVFHYFEGLSVEETSKVMDIRHQSVSQYLKLARVKIKDDLLRLAERPENVRFQSIALSPAGLVLGQALHMESGRIGVGEEVWIQKLVDGCTQHMEAAGAGASKTTVSGLKWSLLPIGSAAAVVAVAAMIWTGGPEPAAPAPAAPAPADTGAEARGSVMLTGGDAENVHVNPTKAVANGEDGISALEASHWWITPAESETVLYEGQGGVVEGPLAAMRASGEDGEYLLHFNMENAEGHSYTLKCNIVVSSPEEARG
ncbi:MAG: sigma-70 family RNA polymerase sigma factor [Clostridiales Family XIII bacterium]|jgi:RNA polymerase sigma-70 factor (ECF subfamily)|nr:sigma-70 family RNA polymerase sigma factor [Clostridiales Family XIII bacterium]